MQLKHNYTSKAQIIAYFRFPSSPNTWKRKSNTRSRVIFSENKQRKLWYIPTCPVATITGSPINSLEKGQRNSSGQVSVWRSFSESDLFPLSFNSFKAQSFSLASSMVWALQSSSSTIARTSLCSSFFNSVAFAIAGGSDSKTPVLVIPITKAVKPPV